MVGLNEVNQFDTVEDPQHHLRVSGKGRNFTYEVEIGEPRTPRRKAFLRHAQGVMRAPSQQWATRRSVQRGSCMNLTSLRIIDVHL
jgi:hypothetical protein